MSGVFLDVGTRLDRRLAEGAMQEALTMWKRTGDDIGKGLGSAISRALGMADTGTATRNITALRTEYSNLARSEEDAARRLMRSQGDIETRTRRLSEVTAKYGEDSSKASAATVALADAHAAAGRATRDHVDAMVAAEAGHQNLATAADRSTAAVSRMGQVANTVGIASVASLALIAGASTKMAGDFEASQMRLVASAGETKEGLKAVSDGILQLAGQVGYSVSDLSNAMYTVEKAGYRAGDGVNVLKAAAQGAKSENSDLHEVLDGLTTSMHDFGFGTDAAADVMSKMVAATGMAKTNFQDFSGALHSVEPIAAGLAQNLDAAGKSHLMADVYGSLAQITQSGTSADQATQNMAHSFSSLQKPTQQMRDEMGALGLDAEDVQEHLGERGLAGTMQILQQAVQAHSKDGTVNLDVMYKNAQTSRAEAEAFGALTGPAKDVAQAIKDNTMSYAEFRKSRGGLSVEQANEVQQWVALENKVTGFSNTVKSGVGTTQTAEQALALLTGGQDNLRVALQLTGENTDQVNQKIKTVGETTRETDGTVKGFNETSETLNAKMDKAKAAFGAAATEMGSVFVPVMTDVANVAKTVGDAMASHPAIMHGVVTGLEALGGAWLAFKAINIVGAILTPIVSGLAAITAGEDAAAASALTMKSSIAAIGSVAAPALAAAVVGQQVAGPADDWVAQHVPGGQWIEDHNPSEMGKSAREWVNQNILGHADGGVLPGYSTTDNMTGHIPGYGTVGLAGGEGIIKAPVMRKLGPAWLDSINKLGFAGGGLTPGGADFDAALLSYVPSGHYSQTGSADLTKGMADCSSAVEDLVNIMDGRSTAGRSMSTGNEAQWLTANGFLPGMGGPGDFRVGFNDHHTQATLPGGTPFNWGSDAAAANRGIGGTGADDPAFSSHYYRPVEGAGGGAYGDKLYAAQARVGKLEDRIQVLQQQISEETSKTKQSQKDRLDKELQRAQQDLTHAKDQLSRVEQTGNVSGRSSRGGSGSGGAPQFGAPLPENFGLGKGIPGFFEWLTTFAADMAIGPIEGAMYGNALRNGMAPFGSDSSTGGTGTGTGAGGFADLGNVGTQIPTLAASISPDIAGLAAGGGGGGSTPSAAPSAPAAPSAAPKPAAIYGPQNTNPAVNNPPAPPVQDPPSAPGPAPFRYTPGAPLFGPASPDAGLGLDALSKLHDDGTGSWPGWGTGPGLAAPGMAPSDIPHTPAGGIDYGALQKQFPGSPQGMTNRPPTSNYAKAWYSPNLPHLAGGGVAPDSPNATDYLPSDEARQAWYLSDPAWNAHKLWQYSGQRPDNDKGASIRGNGLDGIGVGTKGIEPHDYPRDSSTFQNVLHAATGGRVGYFSAGGPSGTDTIPAWLSPGEMVMNKKATESHIAALQMMNAGHYDQGTPGPLQQQGSKVSAPPKPGAQPPAPKPQPDAQGPKHLPNGAPASPGPGNLQIAGGSQTQKGLTTPGASTEQFGQELPASSGLGFGGGLIGGAEGAAAAAASMGAGMFSGGGGAGAGAGMQAAFQLMNRTAGFVGQLGGIAAEGILSTFMPSDSPLSNFSNTLPGKLVAGIAGVRPGQANSAGKTEKPLKPEGGDGDGGHSGGGGDTTHVGTQYNGPITVKADNPDQFHQQMSRQYSAAQAAYPMKTP